MEEGISESVMRANLASRADWQMRSGGMETDEENLRMLLTSRVGDAYGQSIVNAVRKGDVMLIHRDDGTIVTLTEVPMAKDILSELFGWKGSSLIMAGQ